MSGQSQTKKRIKVLIADDSASLRSILRLFLEQTGSSVVVEARDGMEAADLLLQSKSKTFDLLITDLHMPRMTGFELIGFVRRHPSFEDLPIVVLTSHVQSVDRDKAHRFRVSGYLLKPFGAQSMLSALRAIFPDFDAIDDSERVE